MSQKRVELNVVNSLVAMGILVMVFVALYFVATTIFTLLSWLAIPMLIAALIINYKVVTGYLEWTWKTLNRNPLLGVGVIALTIFGYPVVSGFLLMKAILGKRFGKMMNEHTEDAQSQQTKTIGEYIRYEEVDEDEEVILPPQEKEVLKNRQRDSNSYDDLFE